MIQNGLWISSLEKMGDVCPKFSRNIRLKGKVEKAELSITALGVYEAFLNNQRIGKFILAPGCTVYSKRLQYQTYDVTKLLVEKNKLEVLVGTGWCRGQIGSKVALEENWPCAFLAELEVCYTDGSRETFYSDQNWTVKESKIRFSDLYDGEIYDASIEESAQKPVKVLEGLTKEMLIPQQGEIVCEQEVLRPVRLFTTPKGERVIDFGQNLAGYVKLTLHGKKGDRIILSHAEVLDNQGNFYTENYRKAKAKLMYTCCDGQQTYKPHFTFYGFRYIRLDEYPYEVDLDQFEAIAVYSELRKTGTMECSDANLNQLYSNVLWSQRGNFLDIPTDCPQRDERMGWLGDAQVFVKTAAYNYDVSRFFAKWLQDVCVQQFESGAIPDVVPNFWKMTRASSAWGDAITIIPWQLYLMYGDRRILADNFSAMKKWVDYITKDTLEANLWICDDSEKVLWGKHYGDWLALDAPSGSYKGATNDDFVASAFYANSVRLLVKAGKVLGENMEGYERLAEDITKAFQRKFCHLTTQTEHVLALYFHLTEDEPKTAKNLAVMIQNNGYKLQTGFVGTPYLLHVLSDNGYSDVAYRLLLQEDYPSWLYEVKHGATTIWEHWDGIKKDGTFWSSDMNSYNHYAYGSVMDWMYTVAGGIRTVEEAPGFEKVLIKPIPGKQLQWLHVSLKTKQGEISSKWIYGENYIRYEIQTPSPATIMIDNKEYLVGEGSYIFYGKNNDDNKQ